MKRTFNTYGPAFPTGDHPESRLTAEPGIDTIDYFAAHAPDEIPLWFKPEPLKRPLKPNPDPVIAGLAKSWLKDPCYDFPSIFDQESGEYSTEYRRIAEAFEKAISDWNEENRRIDRLESERRYFQWRWYYAEQMLEHRGKN